KHAPSGLVDTDDSAEQGGDILATPQKLTHRPGDLRRSQGGGGDLVKQWLEQMMIASIDQRDVEPGARESLDGLQAAKSGADNHQSMLSSRAIHDATQCARSQLT